jgi:probable rRNA maturation factor
MPSIYADIIKESDLWDDAAFDAADTAVHICRKITETLQTHSLWPEQLSSFKYTELCITLSDDKTIRALNHDHRNQDKPTNVLSFAAIDFIEDDLEIFAQQDTISLGDIVIAYETLDREKTEQNKEFKDHFIHMVTHGFLHLLGYDHVKDDEAEKMEALEIRILSHLEVENPYTEL